MSLNMKTLTQALAKASAVIEKTVQTTVQEVTGLPRPMQDYLLLDQIGSAGPALAWKLYSAKSRDGHAPSVYPTVCVWVLDKKALSDARQRAGLSKAAEDAFFDIIRADAARLVRLRHPGVVHVVQALDESKNAMAMVTEPLFASVSNALGNVENISTVPKELKGMEMGLLEVKHGLLQIAETLDFLHNNAHLIHRALAPESVLITSNGAWKLGGFGFAISTDQSSNDSTSIQAFHYATIPLPYICSPIASSSFFPGGHPVASSSLPGSHACSPSTLCRTSELGYAANYSANCSYNSRVPGWKHWKLEWEKRDRKTQQRLQALEERMEELGEIRAMAQHIARRLGINVAGDVATESVPVDLKIQSEYARNESRNTLKEDSIDEAIEKLNTRAGGGDEMMIHGSDALKQVLIKVELLHPEEMDSIGLTRVERNREIITSLPIRHRKIEVQHYLMLEFMALRSRMKMSREHTRNFSKYISKESPMFLWFPWVQEKLRDMNWKRLTMELIRRYSGRKAANPYGRIATLMRQAKTVELHDGMIGFVLVLEWALVERKLMGYLLIRPIVYNWKEVINHGPIIIMRTVKLSRDFEKEIGGDGYLCRSNEWSGMESNGQNGASPSIRHQSIAGRSMEMGDWQGLTILLQEKGRYNWGQTHLRILTYDGEEWLEQKREEAVEGFRTERAWVYGFNLLELWGYSVEGTSPPYSMKLLGTLAGIQILVMMGSDESHNFIWKFEVKKLGLLVYETSILEVRRGGEYHITASGICFGMRIVGAGMITTKIYKGMDRKKNVALEYAFVDVTLPWGLIKRDILLSGVTEGLICPFQVRRAGRETELTTKRYKSDYIWSNIFALLVGLMAIKAWMITAISAQVGPTLQESVRIGLLLSQGVESGFVFSSANRMVGSKAADSLKINASKPILLVGFGQKDQFDGTSFPKAMMAMYTGKKETTEATFIEERISSLSLVDKVDFREGGIVRGLSKLGPNNLEYCYGLKCVGLRFSWRRGKMLQAGKSNKNNTRVG